MKRYRGNVVDDKWERVRQIVREECERIEQRILAVLEKSGAKPKIGFEGGKWTGLTQTQLSVWKDAYRSLDVETELRLAAAWIVSNPQDAPKSQFGRFLNAWLSRTQNRSSIRAIPTRNEPKARLCAWCQIPSTGMTNGNEHCSIHANKAIYEDPPRKIA